MLIQENAFQNICQNGGPFCPGGGGGGGGG